MKLILVDSDVLIDVLRQIPVGVEALVAAKAQAPLAISIVSRMEVVVGSANSESLQRAEGLLRQLEIIWVSDEISRVADGSVTRYSLSHSRRIPDAFIAATALVYDVPRLSKNQRDYRFIPGLKLLPYPAAR
ncbi:MAG: type II toxin-antitoxin system VapC family toxin [Hymenobacter sp.]|nr:type II toxin-antitoxin system VapC family toxin [Hymenobacter sp.]